MCGYPRTDLAAAALAVIASEDQQFPFHAGFDFKSIREAVRATSQRQEVARRKHDQPAGGQEPVSLAGRSFVRKALEAWFTVLIEALWPKERILEMYLNIAEFGRGVYGVEAAARRFFHKPAARLTSRRSRPARGGAAQPARAARR